MQRVYDNYFKLVTALFVCAAAFLCARLASEVIASYVWTPKTDLPRVEAKRTGQSGSEAGADDYASIQSRNLFNDTPPPPGSPAGSMAASAPADAAPPPTIDFNLVATGVLTGGNSFAIFTRGDQTLLKRKGMEISPGITLVEVYREKVVVSLLTEKKDIPLFERTLSDAAARRAPSRAPVTSYAPPVASTQNENIKQIGTNSWAIDRKEVDGAMANLSQLITQLRVVPNLVDGQTQGFKVFNIRPGSLFSQIGLLDGDVIREINGVQLTGIDVAYQAMSSLQNQTSLSVSLMRGAQPVTLSYEIR